MTAAKRAAVGGLAGAGGVRRRLRGLEAAYPAPAGCAECRGWWGVALGDGAGRPSRSERCPGCGRSVPVRLVVAVVGVDPGAL